MSNELIQQAVKFYEDSYPRDSMQIGRYTFEVYGSPLFYVYERGERRFIFLQVDDDVWCLYSHEAKKTTDYPTLEELLEEVFKVNNE